MAELTAKTWIGAAWFALVCGGLAWWVLEAHTSAPEPEPLAPEASTSDAPSLTPTGTAQITMRLLDDGGATPDECLATLWEIVDGKRRLHMGNSIRCDAEGDLAWEGVSAGTWRLMAQTNHSEMFDETFELSEGEHRAFGTVEVGPGGVLSGVVSRDGDPVEGAKLYLEGGRDVTSGPEGQFKLEGAPAGEWRLLGGLGGFIDQQTVTVRAGEVTSVSLELVPRGALGVRFLDADLVVDAIHPAGPAVGLLEAGDAIASIQGRPLDEMSLDEARRALILPAGTEVVLELQRGERRVPVTLTLVDAQTLK